MAKINKSELLKCKRDFIYFANKYLSILDKKGKLGKLKLKPAQKALITNIKINNWIYVLKARQIGMTTITAAYYFWQTLFTPNHRVAVLAHTREAAASIFEIYKRFFDNLPVFLKFKTEASNKYELKFFHGGFIRVGSANSQSFRGSTYDSIHCSEFAFWNDIEDTIASVFQTATPGASIVLETTANGLNPAQKIWLDENGFEKTFISWLDEETYTSKKKAPKPTDIERSYIKNNNLTRYRSNWFILTLRTKCANNLDTFNQEYPITAEMAFITSGKAFFPVIYPVQNAVNLGWTVFNKPQKYRAYLAGVDTASGSPSGDYSSCCIIDATNKDKLIVVATYQARMSLKQFAADITPKLIEYNALAIIESNSYGLAILEDLQEKEYPYLFRRTIYDKIGKKHIEKLGYATTTQTRPLMLARLHEQIAKGSLTVNCNRLKWSMNTFKYNTKGKAEAETGQHDDLVFAAALALMGLEQMHSHIKEDIIKKNKPANVKEMLEYENSTGHLYAQTHEEFYNPSDEFDTHEESPSHLWEGSI